MAKLHRRAVLCAVLVSLVMGCGESPAPEAVEKPAVAEQEVRGWVALPASPLGPREGAHAFWTGDRVLVIGGSDGQLCPPNADCRMPVEGLLSDLGRRPPVRLGRQSIEWGGCKAPR